MSTFDLNTKASDITLIDTPSVGASTTPTSQNQSLSPNAAPSTPQSAFSTGTFVTQKYNELAHDVQIYLDNSGNFEASENSRYYINPAAILGLGISDTVTNWVTEGFLTFMYLPEGSKSKQGQTTGNQAKTIIAAASENAELLDSYQFRGDGYDLLRVMITPKAIPHDKQSSTALPLKGNDPKWTLCYLFSVYDVEDINDIPTLQGPMSSYMKCLRLKFYDIRYHMLNAANIEYSTAIPKDPAIGQPNFSSTLNNQGTLKTGEAILDILNFVLANPENGGSEEFRQSIDDVKGDDDITEWERGASEIFYTSPAQSSSYDDIEYLSSHHVSEKPLLGLEGANDLCLFHTNRNKDFGYQEKICLTPLSDLFNKAIEGDKPGVLQKEHFFITSHTTEKEPTREFRSPIGDESVLERDLKTFKYGQIVSYSFVDMSPSMNSEYFRSRQVCSVDIANRSFNIQFQNNDVLSARKAISESYIKGLHKQGEGESLFLPTIHKTKKSLNVFPTFSLNGDNPTVRQRNGLHSLLYTGIFQNACISFKTFGLTLRESGTFIAIDKQNGCDDNDYNNKLYGQWFVVNVDHIFEAGIYMNVIYAVKLHRFKELENVFTETIEGD